MSVGTTERSSWDQFSSVIIKGEKPPPEITQKKYQPPEHFKEAGGKLLHQTGSAYS